MSLCLIYPFTYRIKAPVRTHAYRFFLKYTCVSFFAVLSFSLPLDKRFGPTPRWRFLTPHLSVCRSLLWSTTSNVTYAAVIGHQSATSHEPAHRIGVLFISCLYCNDHMTKKLHLSSAYVLSHKYPTLYNRCWCYQPKYGFLMNGMFLCWWQWNKMRSVKEVCDNGMMFIKGIMTIRSLFKSYKGTVRKSVSGSRKFRGFQSLVICRQRWENRNSKEVRLWQHTAMAQFCVLSVICPCRATIKPQFVISVSRVGIDKSSRSTLRSVLT